MTFRSSSNVEPTTKIGDNLVGTSDKQGSHDAQEKQFRISSPSYQQVIYEQELFREIRSADYEVFFRSHFSSNLGKLDNISNLI
jgi:hypothetical protein